MARPPVATEETRARIAADRARLAAFIESQFGAPPIALRLHPASIACTLFRHSHHAWRAGRRKRARLLAQLATLLTGADFHPDADIGPGLLVPHPTGVALMCSAGRDLTLLSRSGTGMLPKPLDVGAGPGLPRLGDGCTLGPASGVEGPQRVGDRVRVVGGLPLMQDTPDDTEVSAAQPAAPGGDRAPRTARKPDPPCAHASLRATLADFIADLDAMEREGRGRRDGGMMGRLSALLTTQSLALGLHRAAHWAWCNGLGGLARSLAAAGRAASRASISPQSCVRGGWYLPHPAGVAFNARAGRNLILFAYAIVADTGDSRSGAREQGPALGDGVVLAAHSCICGPVEVGDNVRLGFRACVQEDVAADRLVVTPGCRARLAPRSPFVPGKARAERPAVPEPSREEAEAADWARLVRWAAPRGRFARLVLRGSKAWTCVRLYRASRAAWLAGRRGRAQWLWQWNMLRTGADLRPWSRVGPGLLVPYPACVSLAGNAGRDLTLLAMSGVDPHPADVERGGIPPALAEIGDGVTLGHHAVVLGPVTIGDGARLDAGAHAVHDLPAGAILEAAPLRLQRRSRSAGPLSVEALNAAGAPSAREPGRTPP